MIITLMTNWQAKLKYEFSAEDGSFLDELRTRLNWDKGLFLQLLSAMKACCESTETSDTLDRQTAQGFWYCSRFIPQWTSHERFPRHFSAEYYKCAYQLLDGLADWYFFGESPSGSVFELDLPE